MNAKRQYTQLTPAPGAVAAGKKVLQRQADQDPHNDPLEMEATRIADQVSTGVGHSGESSPAHTVASLEQRLGFDFSRVRIHAGGEAAESADAMHARAYTAGEDIVFGSGKYSPQTMEGNRLLAHELVHVVQQGAGTPMPDRETPVRLRSARPGIVQMDRDPSAKAGDQGQVLTVVIRAPDDKYTQNVTDYVKNTLNDQNIIEVDNLEEVFPYLEKIKQAKGPKLKKIRLIAHGSTIGGIKMKLPGKKDREFVNPAELQKMAQNTKLQTIASGAMESDATVEFYGCYVGREPTSEAAISTMFQSEFRSPDEALHTEEFTFEWNRKMIASSGAVDQLATTDKNVKAKFEAWLLKQHQQLVQAGDIPDAKTKAEKIAVMRDLFDRSKGRIKQLLIEKKGGAKVRPGDKSAWDSEWRKWKAQ